VAVGITLMLKERETRYWEDWWMHDPYMKRTQPEGFN
jgi:hypothetical protein